jgi:hypothetical protein
VFQTQRVYVNEALRSRDVAVVYIKTIVALMYVAYAPAISNDWDDWRLHPGQRHAMMGVYMQCQ